MCRPRATPARRRSRQFDLGNRFAVDLHGEHAVEDEVELVAGSALLHECLAGSSVRRSVIILPAISSREISSFERARGRDERVGLLVAPWSRPACASRYQALKSIVPDFATRFPSVSWIQCLGNVLAPMSWCSEEPSAWIVSASVVQAVAEWIRTNGFLDHPARGREPSAAPDPHEGRRPSAPPARVAGRRRRRRES